MINFYLYKYICSLNLNKGGENDGSKHGRDESIRRSSLFYFKKFDVLAFAWLLFKAEGNNKYRNKNEENNLRYDSGLNIIIPDCRYFWL